MKRISRAGCVLLALSTGGAAMAQNSMRDRSTITTVARPQRTDEGRFHGTWFYTNAQTRMALWMRTENGRPELKLRYQSAQTLEAFETDWAAQADYDINGYPAKFAIDVRSADENVVEGHWSWTVEFPKSGREERGDFTMYRAGDGRQLVFDFADYEKNLHKRGSAGGYQGPLVWTFTKASKRLVLWDELPF